jgi:cytidylate kinase
MMSHDNTNRTNANAAFTLSRRDPSSIRSAGQAKEILKGLPERIQVVIDGAGTTRRPLGEMMAQELGAVLIDTGKFYRAFAKSCLNAGVALDDEHAFEDRCKNARLDVSVREAWGRFKEALPLVNGELFGDKELEGVSLDTLRTPGTSTHRKVTRDAVIELSRSFRVVILGRAASANIFPATPFKFFIDAPFSPKFKAANPKLSERYFHLSNDNGFKNDVLFIPINSKTMEQAFNRMLVEIARQYLRQ